MFSTASSSSTTRIGAGISTHFWMKASTSFWSPLFSSFSRRVWCSGLNTQPCTTVIWFCVSVPVLSEQIVFAPPIVSHAFRWRTRLLSFIIRFTEYASAIVTASGRPSGMATTRMVTPVMNAFTTYDQSLTVHDWLPLPEANAITCFAIITTTVRMPTTAPSTEICVASTDSFCCSGVESSLSPSIIVFMRPNTELGPTAVTTIMQEPSWHSEEDTMNGFFSPFSTWSDSPVSFDSSIFRLLPRM